MGRYCEYNQLMEGSWKKVILIPLDIDQGWAVVNTEYTQRVTEAREWCLTGIHGRWSVGSDCIPIPDPRIDYKKYLQVTAFLFKGPNDALLFKLAFGGS